jgi:hypothetical protein
MKSNILLEDQKLCCSICGSGKFQSFNNRKNARCQSCFAVERTRLLWMVLDHYDIIKPGMRVMHLAPERPLAMKFSSLLGDLYYPCDINPERYAIPNCQIYKIDICKDISKLPSNLFDVIIHNHVLEHIFCSVEDTLTELSRIMKLDGH